MCERGRLCGLLALSLSLSVSLSVCLSLSLSLCVYLSLSLSVSLSQLLKEIVTVLPVFLQPVPHKDFSELYERMSGEGASASETHR